MSVLETIGVNLAVTLAALTLVWAASVRLRDVSIVDVVWGLAFVGIAGVTFALTDGDAGRRGLLLGMTCVWGLRLAVYLGWRKWGTAEDHRYQAMRASIGPRFWWISLFVVFGLQGVIANVVALPVIVGMSEPTPLGPWIWAGVALWAIGLMFESVGDWQLLRFKADPANRGRVLDRGLWRYTRHPNYFGDFLVWWGIGLAALTATTWWTLVGPLVMAFLLVRVSGVALLERAMATRNPNYAAYAARTSAFFPWPPKP